jgi:hypothetical protein
MRVSGEMNEGCLRPIGALCYALLGKEGRGTEARPPVGHLLGRVEPVAQPATPKIGRWWRVGDVLSTLSVPIANPRRYGWRTDIVWTSHHGASTMHSGGANGWGLVP